jgi:hypothetical protein
MRQNGWWPVQDLPFGYLLRDATADERADGAPRRVLDIDQEAASFVCECFERIAAGESIRSVARWLMGLPESARRGRKWSAAAVRVMVSSPTYVARFPP